MNSQFLKIMFVLFGGAVSLVAQTKSSVTAAVSSPKISRSLNDIAEEMRNVTNALGLKGGRPPLAQWGEKILDYVAQHPTDAEAKGSWPADLVHSYLFWAWEMDRTEEKSLVEAMKLSPNESIRKLADGRERLAQLRTEPWTLQFTSLDGRVVEMDKLNGKIVLVDGWSVWCSSCIEALPKIKRLHEKYRDEGFEVIGICFVPKSQRAEAKSLKVIKEKEADWPMWMLKDSASKEFLDHYGIRAVPATWLFDREGRLISSRGLHGELMEQEIRKVLGLPALETEESGPQ